MEVGAGGDVSGKGLEVNKPLPIALFDMDNTLVDYDHAMLRDLNALRGPNEPLITRANVSDGDPAYLLARNFLIRRSENWWRDLPRRSLGWEVLAATRWLGFEERIATKGPHNCTIAWTQKADWCRKWLPRAPVTVTDDKSILQGAVLVDDYPPYVLAWLARNPNGYVILPEHEANKGFTHPRAIIYTGFNMSEVEEFLRKVKQEYYDGAALP